MKVSALDYELPAELIAHAPAAKRDEARLLVGTRFGPYVAHARVCDLPRLLPPHALLVVNDTRVLPARLLGKKATGGRIEVLLLERLGPRERWDVLVRSSKGTRVGDAYTFGALDVRITAVQKDGGIAEAELSARTGTVREAIEAAGIMPLPPYIERAAVESDNERYQTIFAREDGAVAAPTAGLHFTPELMAELARQDFAPTAVTLHVGLGTFRPITVDNLDDHVMHEEAYEIAPACAEAIARARAEGRPVVAIGTTALRALESAADPERPGHVRVGRGRTRLFVQPGYAFHVVDALFTNFHLPKSTLLALVMAFAGEDVVRALYATAVRERYRFFSYGDAMLLKNASVLP